MSDRPKATLIDLQAAIDPSSPQFNRAISEMIERNRPKPDALDHLLSSPAMAERLTQGMAECHHTDTTTFLLSCPEYAARLAESIRQYRAGECIERDLIEPDEDDRAEDA